MVVSFGFASGSMLCSSVLISYLKFSHSPSRSTTSGFVGFVRGVGTSACFGGKAC